MSPGTLPHFCFYPPAVFISYDLTLLNKLDSVPFLRELRRVEKTFNKQLNKCAVINWIKGLEGNKQGAAGGNTG